MTTRLNFEIDDGQHADAESIKDELGLTWKGYIREANKALADEYDIDLD
jgi:hypothetical protein